MAYHIVLRAKIFAVSKCKIYTYILGKQFCETSGHMSEDNVFQRLINAAAMFVDYQAIHLAF